MTLADEIREFAYEKYIKPACDQSNDSVTIRARARKEKNPYRILMPNPLRKQKFIGFTHQGKRENTQIQHQEAENGLFSQT